ncbi:C-Myc-binding protein isoform X3 [Corvus hawaiiensis]|uniref:C-Myc-binding protein isoform X3 n=1 Tax=Corvus hawaiiensis TaxID=134902 RepID=UPI00201A0A4B|nr:C-Myc-binding protein isoform X3 [Corvus hawaiiensis]
MAHYKAADSKREQFRQYLEKSGVLDMLTKVGEAAGRRTRLENLVRRGLEMESELGGEVVHAGRGQRASGNVPCELQTVHSSHVHRVGVDCQSVGSLI